MPASPYRAYRSSDPMFRLNSPLRPAITPVRDVLRKFDFDFFFFFQIYLRRKPFNDYYLFLKIQPLSPAAQPVLVADAGGLYPFPRFRIFGNQHGCTYIV